MKRKNTEVVGDDIIAFTLWQGNRYYLHEQNNSVFGKLRPEQKSL